MTRFESQRRDRCVEYKELFCAMLEFFSDHVVLDTGGVTDSPEIREETLAIASQYTLPNDDITQMAAEAFDMAQANALHCVVMTPEDFHGRAG